MKSHTNENVLPSNPRFHLLQADGAFRPVAFLFVTERMYEDILNERQAILDALPSEHRGRQEKLFARYDPHVSARAFQDILTLFRVTGRP